MELIKITKDNIEQEHICCAISNNRDCQVVSKKSWLAERLDEGLVFLKGNVRGKCFIEYIPAEFAWVPINANGYTFINCMWVSGQFKGLGYSNLLLDECIRDSKAKGKKGLVIISSKKKTGFLMDPKYLIHKGFVTIDKANPYFELMYLPFFKNTEKPCFKECVHNHQALEKGLVLYYTNQCPFTAKYVPLLNQVAIMNNIEMKIIHIITCGQAQSSPCPFTTFSLFYNGEFITHEIQSEQKFELLIKNLQKS